MIRLNIGPSPGKIELPSGYRIEEGRGSVLHNGKDAVLFAYGPVMLNEALKAASILKNEDFGIRVINMPWLNRIDDLWIADAISKVKNIFVIEDHSPTGALGDYLLNTLESRSLLKGRRFHKFSVEGYPAWGTPQEVLRYHRLDAISLVKRVITEIR